MPLTLDGTNGVSAVQAGAVESGDLASGAIASGDLPAGSVIQVVQTVKTDTYSETISKGSTTFPIPGLTVSITPSSASSKILVFLNLVTSLKSLGVNARLQRDSSDIYVGDAAGSRKQESSGNLASEDYAVNTLALQFLDSPSTTSSVTYAVKLRHTSSLSQTIYVNRTAQDANDTFRARYASSITAMEIAG